MVDCIKRYLSPFLNAPALSDGCPSYATLERVVSLLIQTE